MKIKIKIILTTLVLIALISCKNEKYESKDKIEKIGEKKIFSLSFNVIIESNDEFVLHYLEEGQKDITTENSVKIIVNGSTIEQRLTFKIKQEVLPTRLFISFGISNKLQKISFLTTEISYGENSITIEKDKFIQFFITNNYIDYDDETHTAITKIIDGESKPRVDSRELLIHNIFLHL